MNQINGRKVSEMSAGYQTKFDRENGISSIIERLGGASITQIFVHNVTLPGFEKYEERALIVARPDDVVCVADTVDKDYLSFLSNLGIGPKNGNLVVASKHIPRNSASYLSDLLMNDNEAILTIRNLVEQNKKIVLTPYKVTPKEFELAAILEKVLGRKVHLLGGNSDIVDYANHKHNVRAKALELGVPVPEGDVVELQVDGDGRPLDLTPVHAAIHQFINKTDRVLIKGTIGSSGSSLVIVKNNTESIQKALSEVSEKTDNNIYLVEVMLDVNVSPNILMHIEPKNGRILCVGVTDQILSDKLVHEGNIYPSSARTLKDMMNSARRISKWLQAERYSGLVGFDFGEYFNSERGEFKHFLAEINPRTNAATYPKSLMEHLNKKQKRKSGPYIQAFLSTNIKSKARSFAELSEWHGHLFFNPRIGKGLVPYNTGCLEYGKLMLAFLGKSRNGVVEMYEDFKASLV
ncbi:MAG: hypothetical protein ACRENZ_07745, partial [Thermodesulfobacteriota bacterium]